ncbi:hypothetical protein MKW94_008564 [Papaver nudicaule]|uniref:YTH domain-containing family protein n=1 Tax=Papaver nudicaule TaxID=74823 RepID=A0AA41V1Y3_PAPNU|nr:hypothetical protein [Papaver nudicaule]
MMYTDKRFQKGEKNVARAYSTSVFKPLPTDHQTAKIVKDGSNPMRNQSNGWASDGRLGFGDIKTWCEPSRGPRSCGGQTPSVSPAKKNLRGHRVQRDDYNLPNFETNYENAKFFVIKSFQEADIHKSIKYNVWASTQNGNKKLEAVYHDAYKLSRETRKVCPVFLFFSANGSGQFVGLAEMTGPVDFDKNMDFWQLERWNGFFPVEWHIIKDIPNHRFQHILNELNENRPVTYSRDTQEIGLKKGLEMLDIFKSYQVTTMLLDDYDFYENQGKLLADRSSKGRLDPPIVRVHALGPSTKTTTYSQCAFPAHAPSLRGKAISNSQCLPTVRTNAVSLLTKMPSYSPPSPIACSYAPSPSVTSHSPLVSSHSETIHDKEECLLAASSDNKENSDTDKRDGVFKVGDLVMVYQKIRTFPSKKLHMKRIGPFRILRRITDRDYKVHLPPDYQINNTFNVEKLSHDTGDILPPVKLPSRQPITKDRISVVLCKDTVTSTRRTYTKFLVKWKYIPQDTWLNEDTFQQLDPEFYKRYMAYINEEQAPEPAGENVDSSTTSEANPVIESSITNMAVPEPAGKNVSNSNTTSEPDPVAEYSKTNIAVFEPAGKKVSNSNTTSGPDPVTESSKTNMAVPEPAGKNVSNSSTTSGSDPVSVLSKTNIAVH